MNTSYNIDNSFYKYNYQYECDNIDNILNYNSIFSIKTDDTNYTSSSNNLNDIKEDIIKINNIHFTNDIDDNNKRKNIFPKNKAFMILHEDFIMNGWSLIINKNDHLIYMKNGYACDEFNINIKSKNNIQVIVPISNSNISYKTSFNNYFSACEFISMHLKFYEENITNNHINIC